MVVSSRNFHILVSGVLGFKLLTMTRNRIGPSFIPWGTPAVTGSQSEVDLSINTRCLRFVKKLNIQGMRDLLTPRSISLLIRIL